MRPSCLILVSQKPDFRKLHGSRELLLTGSFVVVATDFGVEKAKSLEGLSDKEIEEAVTGLVKTGS